MAGIRPFDRKGFSAHVRQLTRDLRELRKETERLQEAPVDYDRPAAEVLPDIAKRDQAYRAALARFRAKYPRGVWPVVFARQVRARRERDWRFEDPFAGGQPEGQGVVRFVPTLALQFPVSKPLLEVLRPLMIEVDRWWRAAQGQGRYATGRQRYPDAEHLREAYQVLLDDFHELIRTAPPNRSLRQGIPKDQIIEALDDFDLWLLRGSENWLSGDWQSGRVFDGWVRKWPLWPSSEEVDEIFLLLTGQGPGFGPVEAALMALRCALGIGGESLRGEESLRKLLREPSKNSRSPRSLQAAEQGTWSAEKRRAWGRGNSDRKSKKA